MLYAHFFKYMENRAVSVAAAIEEVNGTGAPDLPTLSRGLHSFRGATLLELFTEYAREFYHRSLTPAPSSPPPPWRRIARARPTRSRC